MKQVRYYISMLAVVGMLGCESLVEVTPPDNQMGTVQVYEDYQTAQAAISGLYADVRDGSILSGNYTGTGSLLGAYTDELVCYIQDQNGYQQLYQNVQQPINSVVSTVWEQAYGQIYQANAVMKGVAQSNALTQAERSQLWGEALVIRSLLYFYLTQLYGAIPYTTSLDYEYNRNLSKTDEAEVLVQLVSDLESAIAVLPDSYRDTERIYVNRSVAQLLLAKVYATMGDAVQAEIILKAILENPLYAFETELSEVFHKDGNHILWQLQPPYSGASTKEATFFYFEDAVPTVYALQPELLDVFETGDLRASAWIASVTVGSSTYYRPFKYQQLNDANTEEDAVVFRLAEVYVLLAEVLVAQDRVSEAEPYLNAIRSRAGLASLSGMTAATATELILGEWQREFFTEFGHRFLSLKRYHRLSDVALLKPNWQAYHQWWPFPQDELLLNGNLLPQNTGY